MITKLHLHRLEALAPLFLLLCHGLIYNGVGRLAGAGGLDYGPAIRTPLDDLVPLVPLAILPYMLFWFLPLIAMGYLYWKLGWDPAPYRRIFVALLVLIVTCVALWLLFPVSVGLRAEGTVLAERGLFGRWIALTYAAATPWNACPSFHVAGSWFLYRAVRLYVPDLARFFPIMVGLIIASTVLIRIHYLVDIVFGLLVSELAYRLVLERLEKGRALATIPAARAAACTMGILVAGFAGYAVLLGI